MDKFSFQDFDAERMMRLPMGAASPLWLAFGGAAAAGAAYYWMTRWTQAANIEALLAFQSRAVETVVETAEAGLDLAEETAEAMAEQVIEPMVDALPDPVEALVVAAMPEPTPEQGFGLDGSKDDERDDLTRLTGIGPKLAAALTERGVTRFEHIAAWSAEEAAKLDAELKLMGRIERDAWVAQAKRFAKGG